MSDQNTKLKFGVALGRGLPPIEVPEDIAQDARDGNFDAACEKLADWWDSCSTEEKAEALRLDEVDSDTLLENIIYIDELNTDGSIEETLAEW